MILDNQNMNIVEIKNNISLEKTEKTCSNCFC